MAEFKNDAEKQLADIARIKKSHPNNLACKHFDVEYYNKLDDKGKAGLLAIVKSGSDNADSGVGCYAMQPTDYEDFRPFFQPVIAEYHNIKGDVKHVTSWKLEDVDEEKAKILPDDGILDLKKLGLDTLSMRVRVGRNLAAFPLPGAMSRDDRIKLEESMVKVFEKLIANPDFGGEYYSITPNSKYFIDDAKYNELVKAHVMFKNMDKDSYLLSAGIASDWPYGRGCYRSADGGFIVWVGEEDHLRVISMKKGTVLNEPFDRLRTACDVVEELAGKFAHSPAYGYITSCPTNLGTGMRASVHLKLPNLTKDGTPAKAKAILKPFGLSVRGAGGEHTPIGDDGTVDISPSARLAIKEAEIIVALFSGISKALAEEKAAGQ